MKILGISAHYHDSAAALVIDGVPVGAVQEERLSRRKHDASFPVAAIEWCLDRAGLAPADLDAVVFYERSMLKFDRILTCTLRAFPRSWRSFPHAIKNSLGEKVWVRGIIASHLGVPRAEDPLHRPSRITCGGGISHRADPARRDPHRRWSRRVGDADRRPRRARATMARQHRAAPRDPVPAFARHAVFDVHRVSRLRGQRRRVQGDGARRVRAADADRQVRKLIRRTPDGAFALVPEYFEFHTTRSASYSSRFVDLFGPPRHPYDPIDLETAEGRRYADCAASVQQVLEDTLVDIARALHRETGLPDLCFGGGVALNGVANARILAESGFERVFVPPAPGDAGCALGAALYADRIYFAQPGSGRARPSVLGSGGRRARNWRGRRARTTRPSKSSTTPALIERIADELAAGRIVGWMDGASEFGPRALGHRSILAAPHSVEMRDRLNRDIKYREEFRPFAPVVADRGGRSLLRTAARRRTAGALHVRRVPGPARWRSRSPRSPTSMARRGVQVLERDMAPRLYALLEAYGRRTGIPVLLNTSFNVAGEPIVNRALEGYSTFRRCGIDVLVAGSTVVTKRARPPATA